eukprot:maker-scaffold67_size430214-snap-gene-3.28 protein:Tk00786 transcript:maker-scaffold67_size430214-snap-gene-3.28-mRNA-1 annotation:"mitotic spindle assembly checkpoint protein mad1"
MASFRGDLESSGEDPTSVLKVLADFRTSRRQSFLKRNRIESTASSSTVPQQLQFDSSMFNSSEWSAAKLPRFSPQLGPDPLAGLNLSRGPSEAGEAGEAGERRRFNPLAAALAEKEAQVLDAQAQMAKLEAQIRQMELATQRERLSVEAEREKRSSEGRLEADQRRDLNFEIQKLRRQVEAARERDGLDRRQSRDRTHELDDRNRQLAATHLDLTRQISELREAQAAEEVEHRAELERLTFQVQTLTSQVAEATERDRVQADRRQSASHWRSEWDKTQIELKRAQEETRRVRHELEQNRDSVLLRNVTRERLAQYPSLVKTNQTLKDENQLLNDTADNSQLLQAQIQDLQSQVAQAELLAAEGQKAQSDLFYQTQTLKQWEALCRKLLSDEERNALGSNLGPEIMARQVGELQRQELNRIQEAHELQSSCSALKRRVQSLEEAKAQLEQELTAKKHVLAEQSGFVKKLQRKIFLMAKERDSYKGVLSSYEQEITFTGGNFEKDRIASMEKIVSEHQSMIEKLEILLAHARSDSPNHEDEDDRVMRGDLKVEVTRLSQELEAIRHELQTVRTEKDDLDLELERRAIKGDYNPTETRVLHFKSNPMSLAVETRGKELQTLQSENEALKARVNLLQEGQSKDLTLLVGQKMDEGVSSQEVKDLKEKLRLAEIRSNRLLEAFKKTSTDFREVICLLTGFKINVVENLYTLYPIYSDNQEEHLAFKYVEGDCLMLETDFSNQWVDFIDLHLKRQNSIPVFLAAIITDLFSRQTFETMSMSATTAGEDEDDPICLD